jgi:CBS-domain-containing membrane protein
VAKRLPPDRLLSPDDDAAKILERPAFGGELMAVVVDAGHIVGMVTTADLTRALQQAVLRTTSTNHDSQQDHPGRPLHDSGS